LFCGECGGKISRRAEPRQNEPKLYYCCYWGFAVPKALKVGKHEKCIGKYIDADQVDNTVFLNVARIMASPKKFADKWFDDNELQKLKDKKKYLSKQITDQKNRVANSMELFVAAGDDADFKKQAGQKNKFERDELNILESEMKEIDHKLILFRDKGTALKEFKATFDKLTAGSGIKKKFTLISYLQKLPPKEKKRIIDAVISPEIGGKVLLMYPRPGDVCDETKLKQIPKRDHNKPLIDHPMMVAMDFDLDIRKVGAIISGLDYDSLLSKTDSDDLAGCGR